MKFKLNSKVLLILILFLSFVIRIWQLGAMPTFISDEASIGYNAYSILKTGRDEWNNLLPLSFKSFGEYKLPLYISPGFSWHYQRHLHQEVLMLLNFLNH